MSFLRGWLLYSIELDIGEVDRWMCDATLWLRCISICIIEI